MNKGQLGILGDPSQFGEFVVNGHRPRLHKSDKDGYGDPLVVNSFLLKREWEALDATIIRMIKLRLNGIADLRARGLVWNTSLASYSAQWRVASEKVRPSVDMDGEAQAVQDRVDKTSASVPIPIIHMDYMIPRRQLLVSRAAGADIDTLEAGETAAAVAEEAERMLFDGNTTVVIGGNSISGYTTHSDRDTDTAANYGGGDFGTVGNPYATLLGMVSALAAKRYHGPFGFYVSAAQYEQCQQYFTDGSGQTDKHRIEAHPKVEFLKPSDFLSTEAILVQLTANVIDLAMAQDATNVEWESPDGFSLFFKTYMALAPRLKSDYEGNLGVAHATSA